MDWRLLFLDVILGSFIGTFGTLIGAGGGFLLLPLLLFLYPHEKPSVLTGISLAVVFVNALSGSLAYARMGRIDVRSGIAFVLAGLPGAVLGAVATNSLDRRVFDPLMGFVLIIGAGLVLLRRDPGPSVVGSGGLRILVESDGTTHRYKPRLLLGSIVSFGVGFLSSLLGIGGGILHVPAMAYVLGFPIHVATATSHFVLAVLSLAGVLTHVADGTFRPDLARTLPLAVGVLVGAPLGARLSMRIHGRWIMRALAAALALVGVRLLLGR